MLCATDDDGFAGFEGSGIARMQITIKHVMHVRTQAQSTLYPVKTSATSAFNLPFSNFKWPYGRFADKHYYYVLLISITINYMWPNGHFVRMCNYNAVSSST